MNFFWDTQEEMEKLAKIQFQVDEYTRLVEEETLIGKRTVFFANQLNFLGSNYLGFGDC